MYKDDTHDQVVMKASVFGSGRREIRAICLPPFHVPSHCLHRLREQPTLDTVQTFNTDDVVVGTLDHDCV